MRLPFVVPFLAAAVALGALPLRADPAVLKNPLLELTLPGSGEVLISQLSYLPRELHNLRVIPPADDFLPFGDMASPAEEGLRVVEIQGEERKALRWSIREQHDGRVVLDDESGRWSVEITLESGAPVSELLLHISRLTAEAGSRLELQMMLEVAGTFLGVPTEGPADSQLLPLNGDGTAIQPIAIHRETETTYQLAQPWWAVGDRVAKLLLACTVEPPGALVALHQWSGTVQTVEAFRQSTELTFGEEPVTLRLILCDQLDRLSALSASAAYYIARDERAGGAAELQIAPTRGIREGVVKVYDGTSELATLPIAAWEPGQLYRVSLGKALPEKAYTVKLNAGGNTEEATLLPERTPKL